MSDHAHPEEENNEMELLKIGELASLAGVSSKALRLYESKDIIKPVKVDPELMYGDGIDTPLGVYEYDGETAGLVPDAPAEPENKFLRADGTWQVVESSSGDQTRECTVSEMNDWLDEADQEANNG